MPMEVMLLQVQIHQESLARAGEGDYGVQNVREENGQVSQPSWVLGCQTTVTQSTSQIGGQTTVSTVQSKVVTFYIGAVR